MTDDKLTIDDFASRIKKKYPEYKDIDNGDLVNKIVSKYPEYKDSINFDSNVKKKASGNPLPSYSQPFTKPDTATPTILIGKAKKEAEADQKKYQAGVEAKRKDSDAKIKKGISDYLSTNKPAKMQDVYNEDPTVVTNRVRQEEKPRQSELEKAIKAGGDREGSRGEYIYNKLLGGVGRAASGLLDQVLNIATRDGNLDSGEALDWFRNSGVNQEVRDYLVNQIGADVDDGRKIRYDNEFLTAAVGGLSESVPAIATSLLGDKGVGLFLQAYDGGIESINSTDAGKNLPEWKKTVFGVGTGIASAALERIPLNKIFKPKIKGALANNIAIKAMGDIAESGGKITTEALEKSVNKIANKFSQRISRVGGNVLEAAKLEGITGAAQEAAVVGMERLVNTLENDEVFEKQDLGSTVGRIIKAGAQETIGGGFTGVAGSLVNSKVKSELIDRVSSASTEGDMKSIYNDIDRLAGENGLTENQVSVIKEQVDKIKNIKSKIPNNLDVEQQKEIIPLVEERQDIDAKINELKNESANLDDAFKKESESQLQILDAQRQLIDDKIEERSTGDKYTYYNEENKFFKKIGEAKPEEITEQQYNLEKQNREIEIKDAETNTEDRPAGEAEQVKEIPSTTIADDTAINDSGVQEAGGEVVGDQVEPDDSDTDVVNIEDQPDVELTDQEANLSDSDILPNNELEQSETKPIEDSTESGGLINKLKGVVYNATQSLYVAEKNNKPLKEYKEKIRAKEDIISGLKDEINLQIRDAYKNGLIGNKVKSITFERVARRLNSAKTPMQLLNTIDYLNKVFKDTEYDSIVSDANRLRNSIKTKLKSKALPSNLISPIKELIRYKPDDVEDVRQYNKLLDGVYQNLRGELVSGIDTEELRYASSTLKKQQEQRIRDRIENIIGDNTSSTKLMEELYSDVANLLSDTKEDKDNRRDVDESVAEMLREDLIDIDLDGYSDQELLAINSIKSVDIAKLSDKHLKVLNNVINNFIVNGKLNKAGEIIIEARKQKELSNNDRNKEIKELTRAVGDFGRKFRERVATLPTQLKSISNSDVVLAKIQVLTGISDAKIGYNKMKDRADSIYNRINEVLSKHKSLSKPSEQALVAVYADLAQHKSGLTTSEIASEFEGRKEALFETINRLRKKADSNKSFGKENLDYLKTLEGVYDKIKNTKSAEDVKSILNESQIELYNTMRKFFNDTQEEFQLNAEIYDNIDFEPIENFIPRTYHTVNDIWGVDAEKQLLQDLESGYHNSRSIGQSDAGSKKSRTLVESQLPKNGIVNYDLIPAFFKKAKEALYDIHTLEHRQYMASVLSDKKFREILSDDSDLEILRSVANQLISNQRLSIHPPAKLTLLKSLWDFYRGMSNRFALGGAAQMPKQWASAMTTTSFALGKNVHVLPYSIQQLIFNRDAANKLMEQYSIMNRGVSLSAQIRSDIKSNDTERINKTISSVAAKFISNWNEMADRISLSPLIAADMAAGKQSWLAFYLDYKLKNNSINSLSEFDIEKEAASPDKEAAEYAEQMTNTTLNINDRTLQPKEKISTIIAPFASFGINAKLNLIEDFARASRQDLPKSERIKAMRMVTGHFASSVIMNTIGYGIRWLMIGGAAGLAGMILDNDDDLSEDEKDKLVKELSEISEDLKNKNQENSTEYLIKDVIYGGILDQYASPLYSVAREIVTGESKPEFNDPFSTYGSFGIPARGYYNAYNKLSDLMLTDDDFRRERYGIESADGSKLFIPTENSKANRPQWAKDMMGLSFALNAFQLTGLSSQEVGSLGRRLPMLTKKLEDKSFGVKRKFKPAEYDSKFSVIESNKKSYQLTEEQLNYRKKMKSDYLAKYYNTITKYYKNSKIGEVEARDAANEYSKGMTLIKYKDKLKEK